MDKQEQYGRGDFLEQLCDFLGLEEQPNLIRYYTNLIYDCGDFIVRLTPNAFRPREEVIRELHWLSYVSSRSKDIVQVLNDEPTNPSQFAFADEHFTVTLLEKIDGEEVSQDQWRPSHFERLGKLTGWLHRVGKEYTAPSEWELTEWDSVPDVSLADNLPVDERQLVQLNLEVVAHVRSLPRRPNSYGPIHFDIHQGNYLLTTDDRLVLFDFENSCIGHHINDIAMVLFYARISKLTRGDDGFEDLFMNAFWSGYEQEYGIPEQEQREIHWFMLNRALLLYGYLLKIWPGEHTEEQTRYFARVDNAMSCMRRRLDV